MDQIEKNTLERLARLDDDFRRRLAQLDGVHMPSSSHYGMEFSQLQQEYDQMRRDIWDRADGLRAAGISPLSGTTHFAGMPKEYQGRSITMMVLDDIIAESSFDNPRRQEQLLLLCD